MMVRVITNLEELRAVEEPLHLAFGVFDGVHIGHRAVIGSAVAAADSEGGLVGVLTFDPHPIKVLAPHVAPQRILASLNHKKELLAELGVDVMIVISFTKEFASRKAIDFLNDIQSCSQNLRTIAIGEDWRFGKERQGNIALLREFGAGNDITINALSAVMLDGERVSSTRIRQSLRVGDFRSAASMLGRDYTVLGTVIKGRQLGRELGFPTANLRVYNEQLPPDGVWGVKVTLSDGGSHHGVGNLGVRPTVEGAEARRLLEVHLFDFNSDIYGLDMEVQFLDYVRVEKKFDSLEDLKAQINDDIVKVKKLMSKAVK